MNTLFLDASRHWSGSARAFASAARGLAARGDAVTIACREGSAALGGYAQEGVELLALPLGASVTRDAWRLRAVLKEKAIDSVCFHTEREHLVVSSAMRLGGRGTVVRRVPTAATRPPEHPRSSPIA